MKTGIFLICMSLFPLQLHAEPLESKQKLAKDHEIAIASIAHGCLIGISSGIFVSSNPSWMKTILFGFVMEAPILLGGLLFPHHYFGWDRLSQKQIRDYWEKLLSSALISQVTIILAPFAVQFAPELQNFLHHIVFNPVHYTIR